MTTNHAEAQQWITGLETCLWSAFLLPQGTRCYYTSYSPTTKISDRICK